MACISFPIQNLIIWANHSNYMTIQQSTFELLIQLGLPVMHYETSWTSSFWRIITQLFTLASFFFSFLGIHFQHVCRLNSPPRKHFITVTKENFHFDVAETYSTFYIHIFYVHVLACLSRLCKSFTAIFTKNIMEIPLTLLDDFFVDKISAVRYLFSVSSKAVIALQTMYNTQ